MNSQLAVYYKNNPQVTKNKVNFEFTKYMVSEFGKKLRIKMSEVGINAAELSRRSGVTKQNIGKHLNGTGNSDNPPQPEPETVEALAKHLNWDLDDALITAGHAPKGAPESRTFEGVQVRLIGGEKYSDKQKDQFYRDLEISVAIAKKRMEEIEE